MKDKQDCIELSVVIPCLNEAETLGVCIQKAQKSMDQIGIVGEVVVADNGSTDGSQKIAEGSGARVVNVLSRGYGNALMGGIEASYGRYIVMGDADDSYDFLELSKFVHLLREGYDLVQGCRLPSGGGTIKPGAMPVLHRWIGNPFFSWLARTWFRAPIHDIYCGMRGFTRDAYNRWHLRCTGMEFATEMIIKASLYCERIAEVPITLHKDGRKANSPHLKTFRDGWRTLRFFILSSPRWLFLVPGSALITIGILGYLAGFYNLQIGGIGFDLHTMLASSLFIIMGYQSILFAIFTKVFAINERLLPNDHRIERICKIFTLERGSMAGFLLFSIGIYLLAQSTWIWHQQQYGVLDYSEIMRKVIPGVVSAALGIQTILSSAFISILSLSRRMR
ncbi:glycosyltransferase family 2 protein [Desulfonatronum lacustre]|uniref:glycosyltransferase family 2 protein n=1 Tax=Desulfonatronum lacustre TaxID=66849 RepID=UPI00048B5C8A|nr:glycosyltransferase family 2 protein [Desulfonatronum lacustre]